MANAPNSVVMAQRRKMYFRSLWLRHNAGRARDLLKRIGVQADDARTEIVRRLRGRWRGDGRRDRRAWRRGRGRWQFCQRAVAVGGRVDSVVGGGVTRAASGLLASHADNSSAVIGRGSDGGWLMPFPTLRLPSPNILRLKNRLDELPRSQHSIGQRGMNQMEIGGLPPERGVPRWWWIGQALWNSVRMTGVECSLECLPERDRRERSQPGDEQDVHQISDAAVVA